MGNIEKGWDYIKSIPFVLKMFEFLILFIAIITLGIFIDKADNNPLLYDPFGYYGKKGALEFAIFVIVVAWLLVIGFTVFFACGVHDKIAIVNWPLTMVIQLTFWVILLFISACLVADAARHYDKHKGIVPSFCHYLNVRDTGAQCGHLITGAVCCFVATFLFLVDIIVHYKIHKDPSSSLPATAAIIT